MRKGFLVLLTAALMAVSLTVAPTASAARQNGLVNINLENNVVQVPVAIAANICNVDVNILVGNVIDGADTACDAEAFSDAVVQPRDRGGATRQDGLINVNIEDNTVQIPIAAAANVCDVDIAVLVGLILETGATECNAKADAGAEA